MTRSQASTFSPFHELKVLEEQALIPLLEREGVSWC